MDTITLFNCKGQMIEYDLSQFPGTKISIGRDAENDIVLLDDVVSAHQGVFILHNDTWYFQDTHSTNGAIISQGTQTKKLIRTDAMVPVLNGTILRFGSNSNAARQVLCYFNLSDEKKGWSNYPLADKPILIGQSDECQIRLTSSDIPPVAASLTVKGSYPQLSLEEGFSGVRINGNPAGSSTLLSDKDVIQIANSRLIYSNRCIFYKTTQKGLSLKGEHISKTVRNSLFGKKKILDDVSVDIHPNEFVAIIGGSGAGKTTIMNALSCFEPEFEGKVEANGHNLKENFESLKEIIGFVPQQDILYENLTLYKMLKNAARLRMPKSTNRKEMKQRIQEVLKMVELEEHRDTVISKLSGGQKKRASIAVELLSDPKLFFLDEPSSGLDPGTEKSLMIMLNHLAKEQRKTIIMVTHNVNNLEFCDQIIFMEPGGRLAFQGPVQDAREFFHVTDLTDIYNTLAKDKGGLWAKRFIENRPLSVASNSSKDSEQDSLPTAERDNGFRQFPIFFDRYTSILLKDPKKLAMLIIQPILIAFLLVVVSADSTFQIMEDTQSMMFSLSCSAIWLGLFNTIQEICKERVIVKREYMSKLKLTPYLLAKFSLSAILGLLQALLLGGIYCLFMDNLPEGIFVDSSIPELIFTLWLTILASEALGYVVSAVAKSGDKAMTYAPFLLIIQLLFSGILFTLSGFSELFSMLTVSKWSVEALGSIANLNELPTKLQNQYPKLEIERTAQSIFDHSASHLVFDWTVLCIMVVFFLMVTLVLLRHIKKDRR